MRLWHQDLIHYLDDRRLLGQHRECCALRGKGWRKKHSTVDYVFKHPYCVLFYYHTIVMTELRERGFSIDRCWYINNYHGKILQYSIPDDREFYSQLSDCVDGHLRQTWTSSNGICHALMAYDEHDDTYLRECIDTLKSKSAELINGKTLAEFELELAVKGI